MKQKIQDNMMVLEKDCTEILTLTESTLRRSITINARLNQLRKARRWDIFLCLLGLLLLLAYVLVECMDESTEIVSSPTVLSWFLWTKGQLALYFPPFSFLTTIKWVVCYLVVHLFVLLIIRFLSGFCVVPSKEVLGQLQSNRKNLKSMLTYREELYNQYIRF